MSSERGCAERPTRGRKVLNSAKCSPVSSHTLFAGDGNVSTPFSSVLDECVVVALCTVIVTQNILKQYSQQREVSSHCAYPTPPQEMGFGETAKQNDHGSAVSRS